MNAVLDWIVGADARRRASRRRMLLAYGAGAVASAIVAGCFLAVIGAEPIPALTSLITGAVGSWTAFAQTLVITAPILLCGLAVAIPFRAGLFNVGGEGQLVVGAVGAATVALVVTGASGGWIILLVAGGLAGAAWAAVPAAGRAYLGVNEVVTTIMLTPVAIYLLSWAVNGPLREEAGIYPQTDRLPVEALLPRIGDAGRLHVGVPIAFAIAVLLAIVIARSRIGYRLRLVGTGEHLPAYLGISRRRYWLAAMLGGGFLAGLAGATLLQGVQGRLIEGFAPGYGFDGIAAAFLGRGQPLGTAAAAVVLGGLRAGGATLEVDAQIPSAAVFAIQAIVIIVTLTARNIVERLPAGRLRILGGRGQGEATAAIGAARP